MTVIARYRTRRGGSGGRTVRTAAEAERLLTSDYYLDMRLENDAEDLVGERVYDPFGEGVGWTWWFDPDAFACGTTISREAE